MKASHIADRLLTQAEVCQVLGISRKTLQQWRKKSRLLFSRLGYRTIRIRESEILRLVRETQL